MKRYSNFLALISVTGVLLAGCTQKHESPEGSGLSSSAEATRPNVVLIVADDFGAPYYGFMGADYVHSPNLDALAARGVVFANGYVPANHCRPSLQTLMTGLLPVQYENRLLESYSELTARHMARAAGPGWDARRIKQWSEDFPFHAMRYFDTLPKMLSEHGYLSFQGGKWWEYNYENGHFTHGMTTGWDPDERGDPGWFKQFMGGDGLALARQSNQAVYDFIDEAGERPFFIWYAPELPHYPFDAPARYQEIFKDRDMSESARLYYANIAWFDDLLGQFLDYLEQAGKLEDTLVVFVNDNGWEQEPDQEFVGQGLRFNNGGDKGKLSAYDQSFRTPVIFAWPGRLPAGSRRAQLIHSADIPATILDYLGLPVPGYYFGRSFKGVIENDQPGREIIQGKFTQVRSEDDAMGRKTNGYWLRQGRWFFSWDTVTGEVLLFDVEEDPREDLNLAADETARVAEFKERVAAWRAEFERDGN